MPFSEEVQRTQIHLAQLGERPGPIDGLWGGKTERALKAYAGNLSLERAGKRLNSDVLSVQRQIPTLTMEIVEEICKQAGSQFRGEPEMIPALDAAIKEACLSWPLRAAHFIGQLFHESMALYHMEEIASGSAYEGSEDLGNVNPGDGVRYKGRGPIQLTGRANYRKYGRILGLPLEEEPARAATIEVGFRVAVTYWLDHNLTYYADQDDIKTITRRINGGYNHLTERQQWYEAAKSVLSSHAEERRGDRVRRLPRARARTPNRYRGGRQDEEQEADTMSSFKDRFKGWWGGARTEVQELIGELLDDGLDDDAILENALVYVESLIPGWAEGIDERLDWDAIPNEALVAILEKYDGEAVEAALRSSLKLVRRLRRSRSARLLNARPTIAAIKAELAQRRALQLTERPVKPPVSVKVQPDPLVVDLDTLEAEQAIVEAPEDPTELPKDAAKRRLKNDQKRPSFFARPRGLEGGSK